MRIAIVGGGVAGALLALRLHQAAPRRVKVEIFIGDAPSDASSASGGLVRGFEIVPEASRMAAESLTEIRDSGALRTWSDYREIGSVYLLPRGADPTGSVRVVDELLPGSATVLDRQRLTEAYPFRGLSADVVGVVEEQAGHISPDRLRTAALAAVGGAGVDVRPLRVRAVTSDPAVRLPGGRTLRYDVVVVAAGAWTPDLLARGGVPSTRMRIKQIQYTVCRTSLPGFGAFVDDTTGLYGRPVSPDSFLLGLPVNRWDVDPEAVEPDLTVAERVVERARHVFGVPFEPVRTVASFDCYHQPAGLSLRASAPGSALLTFTGGSGGAAKTAVAASRAAAAAILT